MMLPLAGLVILMFVCEVVSGCSLFVGEAEECVDEWFGADDPVAQRVGELRMPLHAHHLARFVVALNERLDDAVLRAVALRQKP